MANQTKQSTSPQIDMDDVAEWVGLHYGRNFDHESSAKRQEWVERYAQAHGLAQGPVFVVFSPAEHEADGKGFWSNDDGWTDLEHAQRYDSNEDHLLLGQVFVTTSDAQAIEDGKLQQSARFGGAYSISDDDLCASCGHCNYNPGDMSTCAKNWPSYENRDGYIRICVDYSRN